MSLLNFLGKLHPVILHLPIGFLLLAFMMEGHDRWKKQNQFQAAVRFSLFWGMMGAIAAAGTGYLLSLNGGYEESLLNNHQWLGFGVVGFSVLLYILNKKQSNFYFTVFGLTILGLLATGHMGGSLTHGSNFLSPYAEELTTKKQIANIDNAEVYPDLIQPILREKCIRCHSATKTKGDLLLATIEGIQKGGKTGAVLVKGDADKSLMLERIHLPLEEKEHMPPKGKKQLLSDEIALLAWWIKEGADFNVKVKDLPKDDKIENILSKFIIPEDDISGIQVIAVKESTLEKIRDKGIPIFKVASDQPFVEVDLSRKNDLPKGILKNLSPVAEQLIRLNLSASNIQDDDLAAISKFPHLQKLFLQRTNISDKGIGHLKKLDYLTHLNLYETHVSDESLSVLSKLKRLKKVYLWKTNTTAEGVAKLVNSKPKTQVNTGIDKRIFGDAQLKAPVIVADKDLFRDSIAVELTSNFKAVGIYYTTDGSEPDSTSNLYTEPIILRETTNLKFIATKSGWKSSEVASKQFAMVKYVPKTVKLDKQPNKKYKANGASSLVDLEKGGTSFTDGHWLGYQKQHFTATLDLGKPEMVSSVTVGAMEAPGSYIFFPKGISVWLSGDGRNYQEVVAAKYPTATEDKPTELANFTESFTTQSARYVRVKVENNLVNPAWHPAPGADCWVFIDEISVE